jgi:hypothetical protein
LDKGGKKHFNALFWWLFMLNVYLTLHLKMMLETKHALFEPAGRALGGGKIAGCWITDIGATVS